MSPCSIVHVFRVARAFFRRGLLDALSYRGASLLRLLTAVLSLATLYYLARFIDAGQGSPLSGYGTGYMGFSLTGLSLLNLQHMAVSVYARGVREAQLDGTLDALLATPTPPWLVLLLAPIYRFLSGLLWALATLLVGGLLCGVRFGPICWSSLALTLALSALTFIALGFGAAAVTLTLRRGDPLSQALSGLSALVGGAFYPMRVLPGWIRTLARVLPVTHALEALRRSLFTAASPSLLRGPLVALGLIGAVAMPLGLLLFTVSLRHIRRDGSLTHY